MDGIQKLFDEIKDGFDSTDESMNYISELQSDAVELHADCCAHIQSVTAKRKNLQATYEKGVERLEKINVLNADLLRKYEKRKEENKEETRRSQHATQKLELLRSVCTEYQNCLKQLDDETTLLDNALRNEKLWDDRKDSKENISIQKFLSML
ncbi:hypothetical protein AB6A40_003970 [Gnathostoma spinigerum]|uniref:Uncharacterized protein n=1 Tax=Gnathostoma spinigerum TaxID=75299 RepID=A0ABD6EIP5_9BILA